MSKVSDLIDAYSAELKQPWRTGLSGGERVWMLVYGPEMERNVRSALPQFRLATEEAGRAWHEIDITDEFGRWLAHHEHAEAFYERPRNLSKAILDQFETELSATIRAALDEVPDDAVAALVGVGSIFPFVRTSAVIKSIDEAVAGRLLVFFPGRHDAQKHSFRLLDAHDGFNYRARVIEPNKDLA